MWHVASCWAPYSLGQSCKKEMLPRLQAMSTLSSKKWWGQAQRHAVQHHDKQQVRQWNKAGCFTFLKRITRLKIVNSEVILKTHSPTWKGIPRRVHATVMNPAWITHLLRTIFANSDVECIVHDRSGSVKRPEKVSKSFHRHSLC